MIVSTEHYLGGLRSGLAPKAVFLADAGGGNMPGWYIHLEVARKIAKILPAVTPGDDNSFGGPGLSPEDLAKIIEQYPNYYALGALGPDVFYFLPDFKGRIGNSLAEVASEIIKIYNVIDKNIIDPWETTFAPISEDSNELVSRLTGGLSDELGRLCQYATGVLMEQVFDFLSVFFPDWFGLLGCGPGGAFDDSLFMWSDMFHYRRTNEFACDLFKHAMSFTYDDRGNSGAAAAGDIGYAPGVAFALGWMTHIGTDVTGHAFVNEKVGGPFRLHWQRHHLVENHMDAYTYDKNHSSDALYNMEATSALHFWVQFREDATPKYSPKYNYLLGVDPNPPDPDPNAPTAPLPQYPTGLNSRDYFERRKIFNTDARIPPELVSFLRDVMKATFYDRNTPGSNDSMPTHPLILAPVTSNGDGRPDLDSMNANFQLLYEYLKLSTTSYYMMPKPVPPDLIPGNLDPPIPPGNDDPPSSQDPPFNFADLVIAVVALLAYISDWLLYLVTVLPGLIADLATYPARVVLYQFEMGFYLLWKSLRYLLVVEGFDLPQPDEIDLGLVTLGVSSKGVSDHLLANLISDVYGGLFGYGTTPPSPDEPVPDPSYPRDTVVNEQNLVEQFFGALRGLLYKPSFRGPRILPRGCEGLLGSNDAPQPSEYLSPWRYPRQNYAGHKVQGEPAHTTAGPYQPGSPFSLPEFLVNTEIPGTDQARKDYEAAATPAATDAANARLEQDMRHIAYLDADGHVWDLHVRPGQPSWSAEDVTASAGALPAAGEFPSALTSWVSPSDDTQHIAYLDADGHVWDLYVRPGQPSWSAEDVTASAGALPAVEGSWLTSWVSPSDDTQHIAYLDADGHVQDLYVRPGQPAWSAEDVTASAGALPAIGVVLTSWVSPSDDTQHIAYLDANIHVQDLYLRPGQPAWSAEDVTASAGASLAGSDWLTGWISPTDDTPHIAYRDADLHVQDLYLRPGQAAWSAEDVTASAGAPPAQGGVLTSWVSPSDDTQHIAYLDADGHVQDLYLRPGQPAWSAEDVTASAGAPPAQNFALTSWVSRGDDTQHIAYLDENSVWDLYLRPGQAAWSAEDVTASAGAPPPRGIQLTSWMSTSSNNSLGDPVHYSLYIIGELTRDSITDPGEVSSFNLDSDRGYGYKCWDYDRISGYDSQPPVEYAYYPTSTPPTRYAVPCTPPRGFNSTALCPDALNPGQLDPTRLDPTRLEWNNTAITDNSISRVLHVHDYHPLNDLQIHYLTRFLSELAASPGDGQVNLRWKPMSGAVSYNLYRSTTDGAGTNGDKIANVASGYIDTGRAVGTYFYVLLAWTLRGPRVSSRAGSSNPGHSGRRCSNRPCCRGRRQQRHPPDRR